MKPTNVDQDSTQTRVMSFSCDEAVQWIRQAAPDVVFFLHADVDYRRDDDDGGVHRTLIGIKINRDCALEVINDIFNRADPDSVRVRCVEHLTEHNRPYYLIGG